MKKRNLYISIAFSLCLLLAACSKQSSPKESSKEQTSSSTQLEQSTESNSTSDSSSVETSSESELVSSDTETTIPETESSELASNENTEPSTESIENVPESEPQSSPEESSPEESNPEESNSEGSIETDNPLPPANNILEASVEVTENGIVMTTSCFSIMLPADWEGNYISEIRELNGYGYSLSLHEKLSYDAYPGQGLLFSINLYADDSYTVFPDYKVIGTLDVVRLNQFDVVAVYPSDVQFSMNPNAITLYKKMYSDISSILDSFTPSADATFTAK